MLKRILFIITKSEMGGAQRFLYELVTHLSQEKYDISIAAGNPSADWRTGGGELFNKLSEKNIKTIKIKNFSNVPGIKNLLAFFEIFRLIIKTKPNIIYLLSSEAGFSGSIAGSFYRLLFYRRNVKIIYRIGGWAFKEPRNIIIKKIYLLAEKIFAPFKDIIIVNSEFDRQLAIKNKITEPKKIITIHNGIDFRGLKFLPREKSRQLLSGPTGLTSFPLIGTIANFYKNKSLDILILAAAKIKISQPMWRFMIIGDGPERQKLQKLIEKLDLNDHIILAGRIPDAYQYIKALDLFVLPSVKEGQPWVILEAMAAEIPIVATNIAGIPEMIENEKSGLLVEPADANALAAAIEKMLTHPSLAHTMAKNALTAVREKFNSENMIRKNKELFY